MTELMRRRRGLMGVGIDKMIHLADGVITHGSTVTTTADGVCHLTSNSILANNTANPVVNLDNALQIKNGDTISLRFIVMGGSLDTIRQYMDVYLQTVKNNFSTTNAITVRLNNTLANGVWYTVPSNADLDVRSISIKRRAANSAAVDVSFYVQIKVNDRLVVDK